MKVELRCRELATISSRSDGTHRFFLSPEHARANSVVAGWMRAAGLTPKRDAFGSQWGVLDAGPHSKPAIVVGSHIDTVPNAGRYDGTLGVLIGIAVADLMRANTDAHRDRPLAVVAFGDEEGSRFPATLMSSRFTAGKATPDWLEIRDSHGTTLANAMEAFGLDPACLQQPRGTKRSIGFTNYLEPHIEQGTELAEAGEPIGVVDGIAAAVRATIRLHGASGHAASKMDARHDAGSAAAEFLLAVESLARDKRHIRATIGRLSLSPGAVNVVPDGAELTLDLRAPDEKGLHSSWSAIAGALRSICDRRGITFDIQRDHQAGAVSFSGVTAEAISTATESATRHRAQHLWSFPGHDAMSLASCVDAGMLFVRSPNGASHCPDERVEIVDIAYAIRATMHAVGSLAVGPASARRAS